jgi:hypothetical protein
MMHTLDQIRERMPKFSAVSHEMIAGFGPKFTHTKNGHIQTDIAACGSLAGLMILQEVVTDLEEIIKKTSPGNVILSEVHESQNEVFKFIHSLLVSNRFATRAEFDRKIIEDNKPLLDCHEMTKRLAPAFYSLCAKAGLEREFYKYAAASGGFLLIVSGSKTGLLQSDIGETILDYYVVAGSKTIPYKEALWKL